MKKMSGVVVFLALFPAISLVASAQESAMQQMTGYPYAGDRGPGMGRGYQQSTPGPGRGNPGYRHGNDDRADIPEAGIGVDQESSAVATGEKRDPYPEWQQYPGRRGYGLGYPYAGQDGYSYRGRGAGYGPGRRGYGYGYPGYRGRGGTGYPGHRQYGSPPFNRAEETE